MNLSWLKNKKSHNIQNQKHKKAVNGGVGGTHRPPFLISLNIYLISLFPFTKLLNLYIYLISFPQISIKMDLDNAAALLPYRSLFIQGLDCCVPMLLLATFQKEILK